MSWGFICCLVLVAGIVETLIIWLYRWTKKESPEHSLMVVMGAKVFKLILVIAAIAMLYFFTDKEHFTEQCIGIIVAYLVALVFETIFFLKKK